jgi:HAD superfamily hydrolase (TIGR01484 family)
MQKKVFALDLDGTLTEHRTWISDENIAALDELKDAGLRLVIVGAGQIRRIFAQLRKYPIEILGNYGLQYAVYREEKGDLEYIRDMSLPCDRESITARINGLRHSLGYEEYVGDTVEIHPSGCVTFPLLGTKALIQDKLTFDSDRSKRRAIYADVAAAFPEYSVFVGGSSSFDMVPEPYNKYYAVEDFCKVNGFDISETTYFGDDYGMGGNDEPVYNSAIDFVKVDKPVNFPNIVRDYLKTL